jgi:hypothetical protein
MAKKKKAGTKAAAKSARKTAKKGRPAAKAARKAAKKPAKKAPSPKATAPKGPSRKATAPKGPARKATAPKGRKPAKKAARKAVKKVARKPPSPKATAPKGPAAKSAARKGLPNRAAKPAPIRGAIPSSLGLSGGASAAKTGREELLQSLKQRTETSPAITAGDVDADWQLAYSSGDEAPGGDNPTPDQDVVDEIGEALGLEYDDEEELKGAAKIEDRDKHRWELDPASKDDFDEE